MTLSYYSHFIYWFGSAYPVVINRIGIPIKRAVRQPRFDSIDDVQHLIAILTHRREIELSLHVWLVIRIQMELER